MFVVGSRCFMVTVLYPSQAPLNHWAPYTGLPIFSASPLGYLTTFSNKQLSGDWSNQHNAKKRKHTKSKKHAITIA